jgi:signal transduction histidine kinase
MRTIRARLTAGFTVALVATLLVFGIALYFELRQPSREELDRRTALDASFAVRYLEESYRVLGRVSSAQPLEGLDPGVSAAFEGFQDYMVVVGDSGRVLYLSEKTRELNFAALERLATPLRPPPTERRSGTITVDDGSPPVRYLAVPVHGAGREIIAVLVGTPVNATSVDPRVLLNAMLVVGPIVVLAAVLLGHWLAGTALRPVQGIMDEVEAITDGRSLHRRLAVPMSSDEVSRLALTVNGMLARLEQSFAGLRRFTADASHELKTPLMVLRAGVERALTDPRTPPEVMGSLDETLQQINQMGEMVENLLTLARADEGRAPLAMEPSDLCELLSEAAETAGILAEPAEVRVTTEVPDCPVAIAADRHRIRELLLNLVTNAIKYTPPGGDVHIGLAVQGDAAVITVRDSGIGIAPGDLPHIFERFWRADPARSRTGDRPGTGLGLAITKWIAEAHGGSITVQSRPGRGTTFSVTLPRLAAAEPAPAPAV